jgi:hypothetical protein
MYEVGEGVEQNYHLARECIEKPQNTSQTWEERDREETN